MSRRPAHSFPLSAVVGQEALKLALLLVVVDPGIGGVLVAGHKGTAKSTAVRAVAELLPEIAAVDGCRYGCDPDAPEGALCDDCRGLQARGPLPRTTRRPELVELPVSATEDRVLGTLDFEHALREGERRFEPGLLARAHRGILYVDEVNLLDDHLVDALLDAAASGVNTVEREGVAVSHPARFSLVGTMNPEEGEVRPQLLDRFGLSVSVEGIAEPDRRVEIVRRRAAFEADPSAFREAWAPAEAGLADAVASARRSLVGASLTDELLFLVASIASELGVEGHRADITLARAALARAALEGRETATADDVRVTAPLALAHRVARRPRSEASSADALVRVVAAAAGPPAAGGTNASPAPQGSGDDATGLGASQEAANAVSPAPSDAALGFPAGDPLPASAAGRHERSTEQAPRGRYVASSAAAPVRASDTALDATLRAAASQQADRSGAPAETPGPAVVITRADLRAKVRRRRTGACVVFCVDASGSMGASARMSAAKTAVLDLLSDANRRRDRVGLVTFGGAGARVVLAPTSSVEVARMRLAEVATGGATPLAGGLATALDVLQRELRRDAGIVPWLVLVTDGRANVGLGGPPVEDALAEADRLREAGVRALVVDTTGGGGPSAARTLAERAGARYVRLQGGGADRLSGIFRDAWDVV